MLLHLAATAYIAIVQSPVSDERTRMVAGILLWRSLDTYFNPGNPPLNDMVAAAPAAAFATAEDIDGLTGSIGRKLYTRHMIVAGRFALLLFSLLGAVVCYVWTLERSGKLAAMGVLMLWCSDPLILTHGALSTGDMCATSVGVAAVYSFWKWMQRPTKLRAAVCGTALGFALLSKYVWVLMPLLWAVLWVVRRMTTPRPERWPLPGHIVIMATLCVYVINSVYGFESTFEPWRTFRFQRPLLQRLAVSTGQSGLAGSVPVPLPRQYIMGIDAIAEHVNRASPPTWMRGEFYEDKDKVWWFYLYGLLVKMPLGTWLLLLLAACLRCRNLAATQRADATQQVTHGIAEALPGEASSSSDMRDIIAEPGARNIRAVWWFDDLVLLLPAFLILVFVSWVTRTQLLRYVLPALPFIFIWMGQVFVWAQHGRWWRKGIVWGAVCWSVLSSLSVYPHSMAYCNEAAGGAANGHYHLLWCSYDWGQDLYFFRDWVAANPQATPLYVRCHGLQDSQLAEISGLPVPEDGPEPGWYAISAGRLLETQWSRPARDSASPAIHPLTYVKLFQQRQPTDRVAYSIFIYHLTCEQCNAMRSELGMEPIECD